MVFPTRLQRVTQRATVNHENQAQGTAGAARAGRHRAAACHPGATAPAHPVQAAGGDAPGFRLHPLKGDRTGEWSVRVSGNWRVVFRFEDGEAVDVDLVDYH